MGAYAVSIEGSMAGQQIINSLGFRKKGSLEVEFADQAIECATKVRDAWQTYILQTISTQYTFIGVHARGLVQPGVAETVQATQPAGTKFGDPLPTFVAVKIKFRTEVPGRAGRGRTGIPGLIEGGTLPLTPNRASAAEVATLQQYWAEFRNAIAAGTDGYDQIVISRFLNKVKRPTPTWANVTTHAVQGELGTRVSRLR